MSRRDWKAHNNRTPQLIFVSGVSLMSSIKLILFGNFAKLDSAIRNLIFRRASSFSRVIWKRQLDKLVVRY